MTAEASRIANATPGCAWLPPGATLRCERSASGRGFWLIIETAHGSRLAVEVTPAPHVHGSGLPWLTTLGEAWRTHELEQAGAALVAQKAREGGT